MVIALYTYRKGLTSMATNATNNGRIRNILVVEDNSSVRNVTCEFLSMMGFNVMDAENGQEALELLRREKFDLIITDLMMPAMNGKDLIKKVRRAKGDDLPIILVSGSDFESIEKFESTYTRTLRKPYAFQTLMNNIGDLENIRKN